MVQFTLAAQQAVQNTPPPPPIRTAARRFVRGGGGFAVAVVYSKLRFPFRFQMSVLGLYFGSRISVSDLDFVFEFRVRISCVGFGFCISASRSVFGFGFGFGIISGSDSCLGYRISCLVCGLVSESEFVFEFRGRISASDFVRRLRIRFQ